MVHVSHPAVAQAPHEEFRLVIGQGRRGKSEEVDLKDIATLSLARLRLRPTRHVDLGAVCGVSRTPAAAPSAA